MEWFDDLLGGPTGPYWVTGLLHVCQKRRHKLFEQKPVYFALSLASQSPKVIPLLRSLRFTVAILAIFRKTFRNEIKRKPKQNRLGQPTNGESVVCLIGRGGVAMELKELNSDKFPCSCRCSIYGTYYSTIYSYYSTNDGSSSENYNFEEPMNFIGQRHLYQSEISRIYPEKQLMNSFSFQFLSKRSKQKASSMIPQ